MNPLTIQTQKPNSAQTLLQEHGYDETIKDRLLEVALAAEQGNADIDTEPAHDTQPNLHGQICIIPGFLSVDICDEYMMYISQQNVEKNNSENQTIPIAPVKSVLIELMQHIVRDVINPFFNVSIKDSESPQIFVHAENDQQSAKVDGEVVYVDNGVPLWVKNIERDISVVVFLNDTYDGGDMQFPNQALSIKPQKGMLVAFPSNHHFLHVRNKVQHNPQYTIVNWFSTGTVPIFTPN